MRVGLVSRCLNVAHIRGMGRYLYELLRESADDPSISWRLLGNDPRYQMQTPAEARADVDIFTYRGDRFELWEQIGLPLKTRGGQIDLVHCAEGSLPWWQPVPTIVTLHDTMAWQEYDNRAFSRFYYERLIPAALRKCAAIITISESSRRDIASKWPAVESKICVIPHGIGGEYLVPARPARLDALDAAPAPYVVYMGGPLPRKRFDWALRVFQECDVPQLRMVACGFAAESHEAARSTVPAGIRDRVRFMPFLSNDELLALYRGAEAVLYPTLYEGFGFPAVEAQAAGAPVIFSGVSSLSDLVGPLALVTDAHDLDAWCRAVKRALAMGCERVTLATAAQAWASRFSWRRSYELHMTTYQRVAQLAR